MFRRIVLVLVVAAFVMAGIFFYLGKNTAGATSFLLGCIAAGFILPPGMDTGVSGGAFDS